MKNKEQENLFISTQQDAQAQMVVFSDQLNLNVQNIFTCSIYRASKAEWVNKL